jgi:hypothetical protein
VEYVKGDENKPPDKRETIDNNDIGRRFRSLFGPQIDWHTTGFAGWLNEQRAANMFPFTK